MRKDLLNVYLILTFLISFGTWFGLVGLLGLGALLETDIAAYISFMLGGNGPFIASLISLYFIEEVDQEITDNLKRIRINPLWYLIAILLPILWVLIAWAIHFVAGGDMITSVPLFIAPILFLFMIVASGTEELGWRGIALSMLEKRFNTLVATFIIAVIWTAWHIPLWFIPFAGQASMNIASFFIFVIVFSFLLTWFYKETRSVAVCVVFHAMVNTVGAMGLEDWNTTMFSDVILLGVLSAIAVVVFSYSHYRRNKSH